MKLFVENSGIDVNKRNPLRIAIKNTNIFKLLFNHPKIALEKDYKNIISCAKNYGNIDVLELIFNKLQNLSQSRTK